MVAISQFTFPDVRVKGSSTECPQRRASGRRAALPKERNAWHSVSRASYLLSTLGSLDGIQSAVKYYYLRIFSRSKERAGTSLHGCVSGKGS